MVPKGEDMDPGEVVPPHPPELRKRAVRILLECYLVLSLVDFSVQKEECWFAIGNKCFCESFFCQH